MYRLTAIILFLYSFVLMSAGTFENYFRIGNGNSAQDKTINFDIGSGSTNPYIGFDATSEKLGFSNDGVTFQPFGSGGSDSTSGFNAFVGGGFESADVLSNCYPFSANDFPTYADLVPDLDSGTLSLVTAPSSQVISGNSSLRYQPTNYDFTNPHEGFVCDVERRTPTRRAEIDIVMRSNLSQLMHVFVFGSTSQEKLLDSRFADMAIGGDRFLRFRSKFDSRGEALKVVISIGHQPVAFPYEMVVDNLTIRPVDGPLPDNKVHNYNFESGAGGWLSFYVNSIGVNEDPPETISFNYLNSLSGTASVVRASTIPIAMEGDYVLRLRYSDDSYLSNGAMFYSPIYVDPVDQKRLHQYSFLYFVQESGASPSNYTSGRVRTFIQNVCTDHANAGKYVPLFNSENPDNPNYLSPEIYNFTDTGPKTPRRYNASWFPDEGCDRYRAIVFIARGASPSNFTVVYDDFYVGTRTPSTNFDNIWKTYGTDDVTVTSSQAGWDYVAGEFTPYKTSSGWKLKFNIRATYTAANISQLTFTIGGIKYSTGVPSQNVLAGVGTQANVTAYKGAYTVGNTGDATLYFTSSGTTNSFSAYGDVILEEKPTWADFDPIATFYPTSDELDASVQAISGQENLAMSSGGRSTIGADTITLKPGKYSIDIGGEAIITSSPQITSATATLYLRNLTASSDLFLTSVGIAQRVAGENRSAITLSAIVDISATSQIGLEASVTSTGGTVTNRQIIRGYIVATRLSPSALPPIGLELAGANNPGLLKAYEEGTWTPTIALGDNTTGVPIVVGQATYTRVGRTVYVKVPKIEGFSATATTTRTTIILSGLSTVGLPGVKNGTMFYGTAWSRGANSTTMPITASIMNPGSSENGVIYFESKTTGAYLLWGIWFMYDIED